MDLPRPWNDNIYSYSAVLSRLTIPAGTGYHKPAHGKLWQTKKESSGNCWVRYRSVHASVK